MMGDLEPTVDTIHAASSHPAIRASIDTLPNELLSNIFTMGAAFQPLDWGQFPFPLLVSSISRRWREAAISTQPLWSQLVFTADPRTDSWCADLFLPRSGAHPLDIIINLQSRRGSTDIISKLLPHCERWRKLCVTVEDIHETFAIRSLLQYIPVPLLQHLEFVVYEGECIGDGHSHAPFLDLGAPALTSVKLRGLCLECVPHLANLTSFRFESKATSVTRSQMESIAAASPALRALHLRLKGFKASGNGSLDLPSLRHLSLNFKDLDRRVDTEPLQLFVIMVAPALESLELISFYYDVPEPNALFERFPNHPRPQTLKFSGNLGWQVYDALHRENASEMNRLWKAL